MSKYFPCPCQSKDLYHKCCRPFHDGDIPANALQLMRSRFSAFALGLTEYLIKTTHPENPEKNSDQTAWKEDLESISKHARFDQLIVKEFIDGDQSASVTFTAIITKGDEDLSFTEKSLFEKIDEKWLYKSGQILTD